MDPSQTSTSRNAHDPAEASATTASGSAPASLDLDAILAEVEALTSKAAALSPDQSPSHATVEQVDASTKAAQEAQQATGVDFALLEREIASLLGGDPAPQPPAQSESVSTTPPRDQTASVASEALSPRSSDPMLQDIEQLLDDTNDAVLKRTNGDLGAALESVFDPQALAGQEEDVHRALIEAFGTSRRPTGSFSPAVITNPAPKFDGVSRAVPPELQANVVAQPSEPASVPEPLSPRAVNHESAPTSPALRTEPPIIDAPRTFEQIAAASSAREPSEYAGEKPFEAAFPSVAAPALESHATSVTTSSTTTTSVASVDRHTSTTSGETAVNSQRFVSWWKSAKTKLLHAVVTVARIPLDLASFPMRVVPSGARLYISAVALASVLSVPLAWWLAYSASKQPGIGRLVFESTTQPDGEAHAPTSTESPAPSSPSETTGPHGDEQPVSHSAGHNS